MSLGKGFLIVGVGALALLTRLVVADETPPAPRETAAAAEKDAKPAAAGESPVADGTSPAAAGETIAQLIEQLDSADFGTRDKAAGKLAARGKEAIAALEKAAANGNLEVSSSATTVLGKLLNSSDEATEKAANEALQRLADGDRPAPARKARSILDSKDKLNNNQPGITLPGNGFGGQIIINGGQLNIGGGGVAVRTLSVKNVNGVKEINAVERWQDREDRRRPRPGHQGRAYREAKRQGGHQEVRSEERRGVEETPGRLRPL